MRVHVALLIGSLGLFANALFGQNSGSISGLVTDASGAPVPRADVRVVNQQTTLVQTLTTNDSGNYNAAGLQPGQYNLEVSVQGFRSVRQTGIVLNLRQDLRLDVKLELGQVSQVIDVKAEAVQLQTETAAVGEVVNGKQVTSLAVNGRNFTSLAALVPGASSTQPAFNTPVGTTSNVNISFNGQRPGHNVWRLDGQEDYDRGCGGCIAVLPSIEAISEFRVQTANFEAETGFGSAGQMNVSTKSGTTAYHGEAYEFVRNDKMDAANYFTNLAGQPKAKLRYNTFGYNVGGPVFIPHVSTIRDPKTFFFFNEEWRRLIQGQALFVPAVPLAARTGDFSSYQKPLIDPNTGLPFPGNRIPAARIDPNAAILAAPNFIFPTPNADNNTYAAAPAVPTTLREEIVRLDHNISDRNQIFFRYVQDAISQNTATTLWNTSTYPTIGSLFRTSPKLGVLQLTSTLTPHVVNEASVSYAYLPLRITPTGTYQRPQGFNVPELYPDNRANRLPTINLTGPIYNVVYNTANYPWQNLTKTLFLRDSVTATKGDHTLGLGGTYMYFVKAQDLFGPTQGSFTFNGSSTGNEFGDLLLGKAFQYQELASQYEPTYITRSFGFYATDNWHLKPNLTLSLGLRWDALPHSFEIQDRVANFYPSLYSASQAPRIDSLGRIIPNTGSLTNGLGIAGQGATPRGLVKNYWDLFQPRLGIAWKPFNNADTVLRVGFGIFYERVQGNDIYNVAPNPPFTTTATIFNTSLSNPGGSGTALLPSTLTVFDYNYRQPQTTSYNVSVQHRFSQGVVGTVAYVGTKGTYLPSTRNLNQPFPGGAAQVLAGTANINQVRPYLGYAAINEYFNGTNSNYNSLQISARTEVYHGLTFQGSYTWSHAIDYVSSDVPGNSHQDAYNVRAERGNSSFDRRHALIFSYVYDLPFLQGTRKLDMALGNWQLSGITSLQTGTPINISFPGDNAGIGGAPYRPNLVGNPNIDNRTRAQFFDPAAFTAPVRGAFGNTGRNVVYGAGLNNWNISLFKNFPGLLKREGSLLQFRAEFYNAFNHTQFNSYITSFGTAGFGSANGAQDARSTQLGMRLLF